MQTPRTLSTFFACLLVTLPLFAAGQSSEPLPVPNDSLKQKAHDHGLDFSLIYKAEVGRILGGGKSPGTSYLENLDLKLEIDGEKLFGQPQFSAFIYGIGDKGSESGNVPTVFVGDAQGASNIETAVDDFKLYEAWIQWSFWYKKISLLAGLHDLNSEFYVNRLTSGVSEGINRAIKTLKWMAYGYKDMAYFALKIMQRYGYLNHKYALQWLYQKETNA